VQARRAADRLLIDVAAAATTISSTPTARAAASASASASSRSPATETPSALKALSRVTTIVVRPGSAPPID